MVRFNRRLGFLQLSVGLTGLIFSFVSTIYLFSLNSILWLIVGLSLPFVIFVLLKDVSDLIYLFPLPNSSTFVYKSIFNAVITIYFLSSIYGLYLIIDYLPFNDKSYLFIPFIILSFMIAGTSIDMFNTVNLKRKAK